MSARAENWDFYLTLVDDAPAAVRVDMALMTQPLPRDCGQLYVAFMPLAHPEEHGMGGEADRRRLQPVEDEVFGRLRGVGAVPAGRVRGRGRWQLAAYGPPGLEWQRWLGEVGPVGTEVADQPDPHGAYLLGFLLPSPERRLWMLSRSTCDQLDELGDLRHLPRLVHHRLSFREGAPREFTSAMRAQGFEVEFTAEGCLLERFELVELESMHATVLELVELAERGGGEYLGWECGLETD
jgi:hypothetical protein